MHAQLQSLADDFQSASERLHRLREGIPPNRWAERPAAGGWSVAECIAHLNLTAEAYLPLLRGALDRARGTGGGAPATFRLGLMGWLIHRMAGPGSRTRIKTSAAFVPSADALAQEIVSRFDRLQAEQIALLREADGLPLHRVKVGSPFSDRVRYNTFAAFAIQPAHQHRHLDQAERVWEEIRARA
ncbi:DinB family protein [Longimicrobium terrae]|uniref:DinB-like domain-containing protein n=1 Tax=Longimicrobium terrae TaxID=1639882 RepID=A0A841H200_9BACT|nr:DinB family protein [Longimicrobium terrae]MBB4637714.1 hypothetical protein [Longimicrobium terrae]MBB6072111.1 hypothetical protein [Longimicrobium terrae]NNC29807.1 DinB family protein [Longimicrobium terrae]